MKISFFNFERKNYNLERNFIVVYTVRYAGEKYRGAKRKVIFAKSKRVPKNETKAGGPDPEFETKKFRGLRSRTRPSFFLHPPNYPTNPT